MKTLVVLCFAAASASDGGTYTTAPTGRAAYWEASDMPEPLFTVDTQTGTITINNDCDGVTWANGRIVITGCRRVAATLRGSK